MAELAAGPDATYDRVALAVGTTSDLAQVLPSVASLRAADTRVRVLFLDASTEVLVRRYEGSRPLTELGLDPDAVLVQQLDRLPPETVSAIALAIED